jgi:hypothetical protein
MPTGFANNHSYSALSADALPVEVHGQKRYLRVERSASLRREAKTSKIWDHGYEFRLPDTPVLDKYGGASTDCR